MKEYNNLKNMHIYSFSKKIVILILALLALFSTSLIFAKEPNSEDKLTVLQKEARIYRDQGLACQRNADLVGALSFYQKAVELDPSFAVAFNDIGVVSEARGQIDMAEENYLKAISIDPGYLSAYTNLALLYENQRELKKAAQFWKKRAELGSPDDPWTKNARERAEEISLILSKTPMQDLKEKEILRLTEKMSKPRTPFTRDDLGLARMHFAKAGECFLKRDYATAIKEALDAQQFDPTNEEIEKFIEKVQLRALSE